MADEGEAPFARPSTRAAGGVSLYGLGTRRAIRPSRRPEYQRSSVARFFGGEPCGSKKRVPSKWSETGPS